MPSNLKTLSQLHSQITKLKQENAQLRLLFRVILDTAYLAVNKETDPEENEAGENKEVKEC